jgi:hypothetical protein
LIDLDALIQPLRTPGVILTATILCWVTGIGFAVLLVAVTAVSRDFFEKVINGDAERARAFGPPSVFTRYGPIYPSRMRYLKTRAYLQIADADLRDQGRLAHRLLVAHAVVFVTLLLCLLGRMALTH